MPCFKLFTNIPKQKLPSDFITKIIPVLAEAVKKEPEKFTCVVSADCQILLTGDSKTPGAVASLESIGNLGLQENNEISEKLSSFISKELQIPKQRIFLSFYDLKAQDVALGGVTVPYFQ